MQLEPSGAGVPPRAGSTRPAHLTDAPDRIRVRRRTAEAARGAPPDTPAAPTASPRHPAPRTALLAAACTLALLLRGDVLVLALLLGLAALRPWTGLTAAGALGAAAVRWGSPSLAAIGGAQAVVGPAGWTGRPAAVASAWLGAVALVLVAPHEAEGTRLRRAAFVAPYALVAADLVAGPAWGGAVGVRVGVAAVAIAATTVAARWRVPAFAGPVCALLALVAAGVAA